jgi:hypothetical protein
MAVNNIKKLPFPDWLLQTDCTIILNQQSLGRNGEPLPAVTWSGKCIFSEKADRIIDTDGKNVLLLGKVIVKGDIAPELKNVSDGKIVIIKGFATPDENFYPANNNILGISGGVYEIHKGYRPRNPDGTIHHCEFELR